MPNLITWDLSVVCIFSAYILIGAFSLHSFLRGTKYWAQKLLCANDSVRKTNWNLIFNLILASFKPNFHYDLRCLWIKYLTVLYILFHNCSQICPTISFNAKTFQILGFTSKKLSIFLFIKSNNSDYL